MLQQKLLVLLNLPPKSMKCISVMIGFFGQTDYVLAMMENYIFMPVNFILQHLIMKGRI